VGVCFSATEKEAKGVFMAEKKIEKCAHPGCNCPAAPGSKYCGAYCEGSANGHPSLATVITRSALPARRRVQQDKRAMVRIADA